MEDKMKQWRSCFQHSFELRKTNVQSPYPELEKLYSILDSLDPTSELFKGQNIIFANMIETSQPSNIVKSNKPSEIKPKDSTARRVLDYLLSTSSIPTHDDRYPLFTHIELTDMLQLDENSLTQKQSEFVRMYEEGCMSKWDFTHEMFKTRMQYLRSSRQSQFNELFSKTYETLKSGGSPLNPEDYMLEPIRQDKTVSPIQPSSSLSSTTSTFSSYVSRSMLKSRYGLKGKRMTFKAIMDHVNKLDENSKIKIRFEPYIGPMAIAVKLLSLDNCVLYKNYTLICEMMDFFHLGVDSISKASFKASGWKSASNIRNLLIPEKYIDVISTTRPEMIKSDIERLKLFLMLAKSFKWIMTKNMRRSSGAQVLENRIEQMELSNRPLFSDY